jgi:hypothetical protein
VSKVVARGARIDPEPFADSGLDSSVQRALGA